MNTQTTVALRGKSLDGVFSQKLYREILSKEAQLNSS